jgi:hypothetical protein
VNGSEDQPRKTRNTRKKRATRGRWSAGQRARHEWAVTRGGVRRECRVRRPPVAPLRKGGEAWLRADACVGGRHTECACYIGGGRGFGGGRVTALYGARTSKGGTPPAPVEKGGEVACGRADACAARREPRTPGVSPAAAQWVVWGEATLACSEATTAAGPPWVLQHLQQPPVFWQLLQGEQWLFFQS